jgi:hypothetical protein
LDATHYDFKEQEELWCNSLDREATFDRTRGPEETWTRDARSIPIRDSGADRVRTDDLRLAKPALSQLSYSPDERRALGETQS